MNHILSPLVDINGFVPLPDEAKSIYLLAELNAKFRLSPKGNVWCVSVGSSFTDKHTGLLSGLNSLKSFAISCHFSPKATEAALTDAGILSVSRLPRLTALFLDLKGSLTDASACLLRGSLRLKWLKLPNGMITDTGVYYLCELNRLLSLSLYANPITDRSIPFLLRLTNLRELCLEETLVSAEGLRKVRRGLPQCDVR